MATQWFYGASHARLGPFSAKQLKELKVQGQLQATDMVWKEGVTNGLRAGDINGLFGNEPTIAPAVETGRLPVLNTVIDEPGELPFVTNAPIAVQEHAEVVIPEILELQVISEDAEFAVRAANARLLLQKPDVPTPSELELPPTESCLTDTEPRELIMVPAPVQPHAKPPAARVKRAVAESGAIIVSQDGERVRFRKKCVRCGYEDTCNSVIRIMPGVNRQMFFCPKCRKQAGIVIRVL